MSGTGISAEEIGRELHCKIPPSLEPFRPVIGLALFYLVLGKQPEDMAVPEGSCKTSRIKIAPRWVKHFDACVGMYGSERAAIIQALTWVSCQPKHIQALLLGQSSQDLTPKETIA